MLEQAYHSFHSFCYPPFIKQSRLKRNEEVTSQPFHLSKKLTQKLSGRPARAPTTKYKTVLKQEQSTTIK